MDEQEKTKLFIEISKLKTQIRRIISDIFSEKGTRRRRNKDFDNRISEIKKEFHLRITNLEEDKIRRDTTLKNIKILILIIWAILVVILSVLLKYLKF